jgi:hypothetical protein
VFSHEKVEKCIIYSQLRDFTIVFAQDQNFSKIHQIDKNLFWPKQKKYIAKLSSFKDFDKPSSHLCKTQRMTQ